MTHISLTFEGACEKAIIDALRDTEFAQDDADIMARFRLDTQPDGVTRCVCGETSGVIAEALIADKWYTGHAGYCDSCGSDDHDGDSITVAEGGRYRHVTLKELAA